LKFSVLTKPIDGSYVSPFSFHFNHSSYIPETCSGAIYSIFLAALTIEARFLASASISGSASLEFWGSAATRAIIILQRSTVMDALIPLVDAVSKATTFGDPVEAWKLGGEGTAKLGRATYVMDTGNLPPDPGAMSLGLWTKGMMEGLARRRREFEVGGGVGN
jgi:dihydroxyacetone kinase